MTDWTSASKCNSQQQQQQHAPVDDPWMFNVRYCPYVYIKDGAEDDGARRSRHHVARVPRYDVTAVSYEPPFVDCSSLFVNHHQRALQSTQDDNVTGPLNSSSTSSDFHNDMWTVAEYQSLASQRRQHQLNYSSQYFLGLFFNLKLPAQHIRPSGLFSCRPHSLEPVSYTHLTLPTNREV